MNQSRARTLTLSALLLSLTVLSAYLRIPASPVPLTMQTILVFLTAFTMGSVSAFAVFAAYLAMGLLGLPVFASGGGLAAALSPTFGYLVAFPFAAALSSRIARIGAPTALRYALAGGAGLSLIYLVGTLYMVWISRAYLGEVIPFSAALVGGVLVFLPLDILSVALAALLCRRLRRAGWA